MSLCQVPYCFDYQSFVVSIEIGKHESNFGVSPSRKGPGGGGIRAVWGG